MAGHKKSKGKADIPVERRREPSSCVDQSQEPGEDEEKQQVAEKLKKRAREE